MVYSLPKGADVLIINNRKDNMKYTIDIVKEIFLEHDYELVSDVYVNITTPLKYICKKHREKGIQEITLKALKAGQRCVYCAFESGSSCNFKLPEDIYKDETEKRGYLYQNNHAEKGQVMINFLCPDHLDYGIQSSTWHDIRYNKNCCRVCNGVDRDTANFEKMVKKKLPNIDVIGEYSGTKNRVKVRCNIDGNEWSPYAYNLLSGCGCSVCHHKKVGDIKRKSEEEKLSKLYEIHPDIQFLSKPGLAKDDILCKCNKCGCEWYASYDNLTKSNKPTGCPRCIGSRGEKSIHDLLSKWGYSYTTQKKFEDLKDVNCLPFDIYLNDFNVIIEYDGLQHYKPVTFGGISKEEADRLYIITKKHDKMKNEYCDNHNIPIIRIPYWKLNDIEYVLFDELVKLNVIIEI